MFFFCCWHFDPRIEHFLKNVRANGRIRHKQALAAKWGLGKRKARAIISAQNLICNDCVARRRRRRGTFFPSNLFPPPSSPLATHSLPLSPRTEPNERNKTKQKTSSELVLNSVNVAVLASLLSIGASPRPSGLGPRDFNGTKSLGLCPPTPNCISTAEEANDPKHYVPQWSYNPPGSGSSRPKKTKQEALKDLEDAVTSLTPDGFTSQVIEKTDDYLYAEYTSPTFGFIDDVEFLVRDEGSSEVEYRSASRIGESDGDANRKRIKAMRKFLEPRGWKSIAAFE